MAHIIPITGTELQRQAAAQFIRDMEVHTTTDQRRFFIQNMCVAPVWHGDVVSEYEMTNLRWDRQRGCFPGDMCRRTDLFDAVYVCISEQGNTLADWDLMVPGDQGTNTGDTGGGGFENPMTTNGDLIVGGTAGAPQRLGAGPEGYVLGIVGGVPAWIAMSGGSGGVDIAEVWLMQ